MKKTAFVIILLSVFAACTKYDKETSLLTGKDWVYTDIDTATNEVNLYEVIRFYPDNHYVIFYIRKTDDEYNYDTEIGGIKYKIYLEDDYQDELKHGYYDWTWTNELHTLLKMYNNYPYEGWETEDSIPSNADNRIDVYGPNTYIVKELSRSKLTLTRRISYTYKVWSEEDQLYIYQVDTADFYLYLERNNDLLKNTKFEYDNFYQNYIEPFFEEE